MKPLRTQKAPYRRRTGVGANTSSLKSRPSGFSPAGGQTFLYTHPAIIDACHSFYDALFKTCRDSGIIFDPWVEAWGDVINIFLRRAHYANENVYVTALHIQHIFPTTLFAPHASAKTAIASLHENISRRNTVNNG